MKKRGREKMRKLLAVLAAKGYNEDDIRQNILPSWWDDEIAGHALGYTEALWTIAKVTGLDAAILRKEADDISLDN